MLLLCSFIVFLYPLQCVADTKTCDYGDCACVKETFWKKSNNIAAAISNGDNEISISNLEKQVDILQNLLAAACPKENTYHWAWVPSLTTITIVTGVITLIVISANHMRNWGWWGSGAGGSKCGTAYRDTATK